MAVYKAKEEKWTKDGRKWFFVASFPAGSGRRTADSDAGTAL